MPSRYRKKKESEKKQNDLYYEKNLEKILQKKKQNYVENKQEILQKMHQHYEDKKEEILQKKHQHYEDKKEEILQKMHQHYEDKKEETLQKKHQHYEDKKEEIIQKMHKHYEDNKAQILQKRSAHYKNNRTQILQRVCKHYMANKNMISQQKITYYLKKRKQILGKQAINKLKKSKILSKQAINKFKKSNYDKNRYEFFPPNVHDLTKSIYKTLLNNQEACNKLANDFRHSYGKHSKKMSVKRLKQHVLMIATRNLINKALSLRQQNVRGLLKTTNEIKKDSLKSEQDFGSQCHTASSEPFYYDSAYTITKHDVISVDEEVSKTTILCVSNYNCALFTRMRHSLHLP